MNLTQIYTRNIFNQKNLFNLIEIKRIFDLKYLGTSWNQYATFSNISNCLSKHFIDEREIVGSNGLPSFSLSLKNLSLWLSKRHPRHSAVHYAFWPFRCRNSRANVHVPVTRRYPAITRLSRSPLWTSRLIEKPKFLERWSLWPCVDPRIAAGYVTVNPFDVTTAVPYTLKVLADRLRVASQSFSSVCSTGIRQVTVSVLLSLLCSLFLFVYATSILFVMYFRL